MIEAATINSEACLRKQTVRYTPVLRPLVLLSACTLFGGHQYVVFFGERSAQLDGPAQRVIAEVATRAKDDPATRVEVTGYTDNAGSPPADVVLSKQRAQAVVEALTANGVAANRLLRHAHGQTGENAGLASRRVEITIGDL